MKKKIISAVAVSVVLVIVFLIVRSTVLVPTNKYNAALACIDAGDYISAYNILKDLKSFKDSEEKAASIFEDYKKALMKNIKPGSTIYLGRYEQDRDISSGKEDIEWIVLEVKDNRALIISKCALDRKPYNVTNDVVTWETCTLRTWLNTEFLSEAFSEEEQAKIALSTVTADLSAANPTHNQGNDTQDKVFLLSSTEAYKYLVTDDGCKNTKYASIEEKAKEKECAWMTRTIRYGKTCSQSIIVGKLSSSYASPDRSSYSDVSSHKYIRPAMWITLDS